MVKKKVKFLDTNVVIRFLTADDLRLAEKAEKLFLEAEKGELIIPDFILTEIVWVLLSFYKLGKDDVIEKLEAMLAFDKFALDRKILRQAVSYWRRKNISFVDAYLLSLSINRKGKLISFDQKLNKLVN